MANERRLIDADKILKFCEDGLNNPNPTKTFGHDAIEIMAEIQCAPTVDAVEVVRCGQCVNYCKAKNGHMYCSFWDVDDYEEAIVHDDDFCSYGEKGGTQPQREDV